MINKVKSFGTFGVNICTTTDKNSTEESNEYSAYNKELTDEITAILESRGYIVNDLFLTFHTQEECTEFDIINFEKRVKNGKKNAEKLYRKANIETIRIEL